MDNITSTNTVDLVVTGSGARAVLRAEWMRAGKGAYRMFGDASARVRAAVSQESLADIADKRRVDGPALRLVMPQGDPGSPPRGGVVC